MNNYKLSTFFRNSEIFTILDSIEFLESKSPIKVKIFYTGNYTFQEIYEEWQPLEFEKFSFQKIYEDDKYCLKKINNDFPEKYKKRCPKCNQSYLVSEELNSINKLISYFLEFKEHDFFMIICNHEYKLSSYIFNYFEKFYPFVQRIYFKSFEIKNILNHINSNNFFGETLFAIESIAKNSLAEETIRCYRNISIKELFEDLKNRNLWLDNITVKGERTNKIQISRNGKIQYYNNISFSELFDIFDYIFEQFLKNNFLIKTEETKKVFILELTNHKFDSFKKIEELIDQISKIKNYSISIINQNELFLEASILDYTTGFTCDIWILENNKIRLIPNNNDKIGFVRFIDNLVTIYDGKFI